MADRHPGQFKPGNPGGPGRPKGSISLKDLIEDEWAKITKEVPDPETGQRVRTDAKRMAVRRIILESLGNGSKALESFKFLADRAEGTPAETIQVQGTGELNIRIVPLSKNDLKDSGNVEVNEFHDPPPADGKVEPPGASGPGEGGTGT